MKLDHYLCKYPGRAFVFLLFMAIPAFLINLGLLPLFADEPTRANVALEMILTGNFSVPTVGGQYYYNKPPLYNWVLAGFYALTGNFSELVTRLPAIISLFLFAITIYFTAAYFLKDKKIAALSGLLFITGGRILLYDSMLGHIDFFYSWLTFIAFTVIFYFYKRQNWFFLFFVSYLLAALGFLTKGLPSVLFQGITILTFLLYTNNIKKLFSLQHLFSVFFCFVFVGAYFYNYSRYNPNISEYLSTMWDQSSQRTAVNIGAGGTVKHVLIFPFEHLWHLFPASLLVIFCFNRYFISGVRENDFLKFLSLVFLVNIVIYWLSPQTRPRYLFMLYPLVIIIWSHAYYSCRNRIPRLDRLFNSVLFVLSVLVTLFIPVAFFAGLEDIVENLYLKALVVFLLTGGCSFFIYHLKESKVFPFLALLIVIRLAFSWFVLPHRLQNSDKQYYRQAAAEMGELSRNDAFYLYQYHPAPLDIPFHDRLIFYLQKTRMKQVAFTEIDNEKGYYLTFDRTLDNPTAILLKTYRNNLKLFKVK